MIHFLCDALPILASAAIAFQQASDTVVIKATTPRHPGVATLVSEMQIGGAGATAPEYTFAMVRDIQLLHDGSILVQTSQPGTQSVRIFDSTGKYLRSVTQSVGGRGAVSSAPSDVAVLRDGRILWRGNPNIGQIFAYDSSGTGRPFFSHRLIGGTGSERAMTVTQGGTVYLNHANWPPRTSLENAPRGFARVNPTAATSDTIYLPDLPVVGPPMLRASQDRDTTGLRAVGYLLPYAPQRLITLSPLGYFVTANTGRYALDLLIPDTWRATASPPPIWKPGDRVISIRRDNVVPVRIDEGERISRRASLEKGLQNVDPSWRWTGPEIPHEKAPIQSISFGIDGPLWVRLATPSDSFPDEPIVNISISFSGTVPLGPVSTVVGRATAWRETSYLYDVIQPDGTYLGQVSIPFSINVKTRRGDYVWGILRTAGVETVHRFRINWSTKSGD